MRPATMQPQGYYELNPSSRLAQMMQCLAVGGHYRNIATNNEFSHYGNLDAEYPGLAQYTTYQTRYYPVGKTTSFFQQAYLLSDQFQIGTSSFVEFWYGYPSDYHGVGGSGYSGGEPTFLLGSTSANAALVNRLNDNHYDGTGTGDRYSWGSLWQWGGDQGSGHEFMSANDTVPGGVLTLMLAAHYQDRVELWRDGRLCRTVPNGVRDRGSSVSVVGSFVDSNYWTSWSDMVMCGRGCGEVTTEEIKAFFANPFSLFVDQYEEEVIYLSVSWSGLLSESATASDSAGASIIRAVNRTETLAAADYSIQSGSNYQTVLEMSYAADLEASVSAAFASSSSSSNVIDATDAVDSSTANASEAATSDESSVGAQQIPGNDNGATGTATGRFPPSRILVGGGVTPDPNSLSEDPDTNDGLWYVGAQVGNAQPIPTIYFNDPVASLGGTNLTAGAGKQMFKLRMRKNATGGADSNVTVTIKEGRLIVASATFLVTNTDPGQVFSFTWDAALLANSVSTSTVNIIVSASGTTADQGANQRFTDLGSVSWIAMVDGVPGQGGGSVVWTAAQSDSAAVADSSAPTLQTFAIELEAVAAGDSLTTTSASSSALIEPSTATDGSAPSVASTAVAAESSTATHAQSVANASAANMQEVSTGADAVSGSNVTSAARTEASTVASIESAVQTANAFLSELISAVDLTTGGQSTSRTQAESSAAGDVVGTFSGAGVVATESTTALDSAVQTSAQVITHAEGATGSDTAQGATAGTAAATDDSMGTDTGSAGQSTTAATMEATALLDKGGAVLQGQTATSIEPASAAESSSALAQMVASGTALSAAVDSAAATAAMAAAQAESAGTSDGALAAEVTAAASNEPSTAADNTGAISLGQTVVTNEMSTVSDSNAVIWQTTAARAESSTVSDGGAATLASGLALVEALGAADSTTAANQLQSARIESLSASDGAVATSLGQMVFGMEAMVAADAGGATVQFTSARVELSLADSTAVASARMDMSTTEAATASDSASTTSPGITASISEATIATDLQSVISALFASRVEATVALDVQAALAVVLASLMESMAAGDHVNLASALRALILIAGQIEMISDALIGTGQKPLVMVGTECKQRSAAEGTPLVLDQGRERLLRPGETIIL